MNGIESAQGRERGRRTAQINLLLDFKTRIEEPLHAEIGKCVASVGLFYFRREEENSRQEELKEEEKEPHRGDR